MKDNGRHIRLLIGLGVASLLLLGKIFSLQIVDRGYKEDADRNATIYETIYPTRGVIYDRNGTILVGKTPVRRGCTWACRGPKKSRSSAFRYRPAWRRRYPARK